MFPFEGLRPFLQRKKIFSLYFFLNFLVTKTLEPDWIRIQLKCWIRIRIRIHRCAVKVQGGTVSFSFFNYSSVLYPGFPFLLQEGAEAVPPHATPSCATRCPASRYRTTAASNNTRHPTPPAAAAAVSTSIPATTATARPTSAPACMSVIAISSAALHRLRNRRRWSSSTMRTVPMRGSTPTPIIIIIIGTITSGWAAVAPPFGIPFRCVRELPNDV